MSNLQTRLKALQRVQDARCAEGWERFITALVVYRNALCRQGVPEDVAHRYLTMPVAGAISAEESAMVDAAQTHVQTERAAANHAAQHYDRLRLG